MRKLILLLGFLLSIFSYQTSVAQWIQTNGPYGSRISCMTFQGNNIYVGTIDGGGVYLSNDEGETWKAANNGINNDTIKCLASNDNDVYAGTYSKGLFLSKDNGEHWTAISSKIKYSVIYTILIKDTNVFIGTYGGVLLTTNNGESWKEVNNGLKNKFITRLTNIGEILIAGTSKGRIYTSNVNGGNWIDQYSGLPYDTLTPLTLVSMFVENTYIYMLNSLNEIYVSSDTCKSWTMLSNGNFSHVNISTLAVKDSTIYAGTFEEGIYKSSDFGRTWKRTLNILVNSAIETIEVKDNKIYAGTNGGIFVSDDGGLNWDHKSIGLGKITINSLATFGNKIFAGSTIGRIFLTSDFGNNWKLLTINGTNSTFISFAIKDTSIFTVNNGLGVFHLKNIGEWWGIIPFYHGLISSFTVSIALKNDSLYVGDIYGNVFVSPTYVDNWVNISYDLPNENINSIVIKGRNILIGTHGSGVYKSSNYGNSWTQEINGLTDKYIKAMVVNGEDIYAGTSSGRIFKSIDEGETWNIVFQNTHSYNWISSIIAKDNYIIATTANGTGIVYSKDNGLNWLSWNDGFPGNIEPVSITCNDSIIYAGTMNEGIWYRKLSESEGVEESLGFRNITEIKVRPNPFDESSVVCYQLSVKSYVTIKVYDIIGKEIKVLMNEVQDKGKHTISFDASGLKSGVYFLNLSVNGNSVTRKLIKY